MNALLLTLIASWRVAVGEAVLETLHTADLDHLAVRVTAVDGDSLDVECRVDARRIRPGRAHFLLSARISGLEATDPDGRPLDCSLADAGLDALARLGGAPPGSVPAVLTVGPPGRAGERLSCVLRYRWSPGADGLAFAAGGWFQTHLSGFWLPTMADQRFTAEVRARFPGPVCVTGERQPDEDGWRVFRTSAPVSVLCLVAGDFAVHAAERDGRRLEVWAPKDPDPAFDPQAVLEDLAQVLALLSDWFGPGAPRTFRVVVDPRTAPVPSYCAGDFAVVHRDFLPSRAPRDRWLSLLAHEVSHVWWGHRVAMPVVGRGGTWLREGLAQWAGDAAAAALLPEGEEATIPAREVARYLGTVDLRRAADGSLFANEVTLMDATYLDPPVVPYLRGGLVFRLWEERLGPEAFRERLRAVARDRAGSSIDGAAFARVLGDAGLAAYYAQTSRLPDLRLEGCAVDGARVRAQVRCDDPRWPGGPVPVVIRTATGETTVVVEVRGGAGALDWSGDAVVESVEVDPARLTLDPIGSNNHWPDDAGVRNPRGPGNPRSPSAAASGAPRTSGSGD